MRLRIVSAVTVLVLIAVGLLLCQHALIEREAERQRDLFVIRAVIDQYTIAQGARPKSAADLVRSGYIREVPKDIADDLESLLNE